MLEIGAELARAGHVKEPVSEQGQEPISELGDLRFDAIQLRHPPLGPGAIDDAGRPHSPMF